MVKIIFSYEIVILIIKRYFILLQVHKINSGPIADEGKFFKLSNFLDTLYTTGNLKRLIIESLINLLCIPPQISDYFTLTGSIMVDYNYNKIFNSEYIGGSANSTVAAASIYETNKAVILYYNFSTIMLFFILIRIYHLLRVVNTFSYWTGPRANTICKIMHTKATTTFGIKAYVNILPFYSLTLSVILVIVVFGIAEYLFENYNSSIINNLEETGTNGL